jgi:tight adherence protein C
MTLLVQLLTFTSVFFLFLSVLAYSHAANSPLERRIRGVKHQEADRPPRSKTYLQDQRKKNVVASLGGRIAPSEMQNLTRSRKKLAYAGYYTKSAYYTFWGSRLILALGFMALAFSLSMLIGLQPNQLMICIYGMGSIGFLLPDFYLYLRKQTRHEDIFCGMPDMLDLIVVCLEAGLGLDAAMQKVSEELHLSNQTLSQELQITCISIRLGQSRNDALHDLAERTGSLDLRTFTSVILQAERFGTSVTKALRVHAEDLRSRRQQRAEELAAKTSVKLIFPLAIFIFPAIFVVTAGPAIIRVYEEFIKR